MKKNKVVKISLIISFIMLLNGCSIYTETKAPCDYQGTFCGSKISINQ